MEIHQLGAIVDMPYDPLKDSGNVSENIKLAQDEKAKEYQTLQQAAQRKKALMIGGGILAAGLLYYFIKKRKK